MSDVQRREGVVAPAYRRIADMLRLIVLQHRDTSVRLPTEMEIAKQTGVGRQTVRRAYQELIDDGLVVRIPGRGSFSRRDGQRTRRSFGGVDDLLNLSVDTELEIVSSPESRIAPLAAQRLGLTAELAVAVTTRRLRCDVPFCVSDVYLPPRVGALVAEHPDLRKGARGVRTIIGLIAVLLPEAIRGADQTVTVTPADSRLAAAAECVVGEPMLRIERVYRTVSGEPVELAVTCCVPSRYSYRSVLRRGSS